MTGAVAATATAATAESVAAAGTVASSTMDIAAQARTSAADTEDPEFVDGSEPVGDTEWLDDADGRQRVFIQTTGTSALVTLQRAQRRGARAATARSAARQVANGTVDRTDRIVAAVQKLDPSAFVMYESKYTVPGVAMEASVRALRAIESRADVVTVVELPTYRASNTATTPDTEDTPNDTITPANAASADLVKAVAAWQAGHTGQGVVVAVADSGFDYTHAHFGGAGTVAAYNSAKANPAADPVGYDTAKIAGMIDLAGATGTGENRDNNPIPPIGEADHGTHVAGIVAGWGVNANGSTYRPANYTSLSAASLTSLQIGPGMAPNAKLWPIKIFADGAGTTSLGVASMEYVAEQVAAGKRIDIINQSIGSDWGQISNTYNETAIRILNQSGIIAVISQGNGGDYVDVGGSPAVQERALSVASATKERWISPFSGRGAHGSYDGRVKPDLSAVGSDVYSANSGTGSGGISKSGTSMSAPMAAGAAAVAVSAHPSWVQKNDNAALRFKALMMNTASTSVTDEQGRISALTRTGTGMINTADAAKSKVWLASDDNGSLVTASFGVVEAATPTAMTRTVTVRNDGTSAVTFHNISYVPFTTVPGVNFSVSPTSATIPAGGTAKVTITLSIPDPSALRRTIDPTMSTTTSISGSPARQYLSEASGILDLQSNDPANVPWLRLGVYAAPKIATAMVGQAPVFDGSDPLTGRLALGGTGWNYGSTPFTEAAQPLTMGFQWGLTDDNNNVAETDYVRRSGDTDLIGAATNAPELSDKHNATLYFAISARGDRPRPVTGLDSVGAAIELTTKFNNQKYKLELIQPKNQGSSVKDDRYIVRTIRVSDGAVVETQSVNGYDAHWDTNVFDNNVWILTTKLDKLGFTSAVTNGEIEYKARLNAGGLNDDTGFVTYDAYSPDVWFERPAGFNSHFVKSIAGTNMAIHRKSQDTNAKVLLVHMHNKSGTRTQVLNVPPDQVTNTAAPTIAGTPVPGETLTATAGTWGGAAAITTSFQWLRDGSPISGATSPTYQVVQSDARREVSVRVTAQRGSKQATANSSSMTIRTGEPAALTPPTITGTPQPGQTLSVNPGTWIDADGATFTYQWLRDATPIAGATGPQYAVALADVGTDLIVRVTARRGVLEGSAVTATVRVVAVPADGGNGGNSGTGGNGGANGPGGSTGGTGSGGSSNSGGNSSGTSSASKKRAAKVKVKVSKKRVKRGKTVKVRVRVTTAARAAGGKVRIKISGKKVRVYKLKKGQRTVKVRLQKRGRVKITVRYLGSKTVKAKSAKKVSVRVR